MKITVLKLLTMMLLLPLVSRAQKAYETVPYHGQLHKHYIFLHFANGYIGASEIIYKGIKTITYTPEWGTVNEIGQLKFGRMGAGYLSSTDYIILENLTDVLKYSQHPLTASIIVKGRKRRSGFESNRLN